MDLGARIMAWRAHKGWTQQKLAKKLDLTPAAICQWERRNTKPRTKHIVAMAQLLGVSMEAFYGPVPKAKRAA